jgi:hypothetical protein
MTVVLQGPLYRDRRSGLYVSGGTAIGIPTAPVTHVQRTDDAGSTGLFAGLSSAASSQRLREILIRNETLALPPFLAALDAPTERFFTQAFVQVEVPPNSSRITYSDRQLLGTFPAAGAALAQGNVTPPLAVDADTREETLMHVDRGMVSWPHRDPGSRWRTGVAPTLAVHYTDTLNRADRVRHPATPRRPSSTRRIRSARSSGDLRGSRRSGRWWAGGTATATSWT